MTDLGEIREALQRLADAADRHGGDAPVLVRLRNLAQGTAAKLQRVRRGSKNLLAAIDAATAAVASIDLEASETHVAAMEALQALRGLDGQGADAMQPGGFGWVRDRTDPRDQLYSAALQTLKTLPPAVDLRPLMPPVYDQGQLNSCSANAIGACMQYVRARQHALPDFVPSRLFIYYNTRTLDQNLPLDTGGSLRSGLASVAQLGVCPEPDWPYDSPPANVLTRLFPPGARAVQRPDPAAYGMALQHIAISYWSIVQDLDQLKACLADGFPFVFGFYVYANFYASPQRRRQDARKIVERPMPTDNYVDGHAVTAVGYDDSRQAFIVRNSWGNVQDAGHFLMSYAYVTDSGRAFDFWTIRAAKA